jgi:hypothetical protein
VTSYVSIRKEKMQAERLLSLQDLDEGTFALTLLAMSIMQGRRSLRPAACVWPGRTRRGQVMIMLCTSESVLSSSDVPSFAALLAVDVCESDILNVKDDIKQKFCCKMMERDMCSPLFPT